MITYAGITQKHEKARLPYPKLGVQELERRVEEDLPDLMGYGVTTRGGRGGVREGEELGRLRRVVALLIEAQQEALDATTRGLDSGGADPEDDAQLLEANERLEEALVDVRDILEGASDDVRGTLGDEGGVA